MEIPHPGLAVPGPLGPNTLELVKLLGAGAFGFVFLAKETSSDTLFAVKFPQVALTAGQEMMGFYNEIRAAQEIQHPNVVRVLHIETEAPELPPYLVMEYMPDGTLKAHLEHFSRQGQMPTLLRLRAWGDGLVAGIAAINAKMLHRDLKPDNILMDGETPKIADFGLSKIVDAATRTQTFKGGQHVLYMAPEGWRLETNRIQLDMYAMGIVLYQATTLQYPYRIPSQGSDFDAFRDMHLYEKARPLSELRSDIPAEFSQVVSRLMEKRYQDRFASWEEVKAALACAWDTSLRGKSPASGLITSLLEETERAHDALRKSQLEEAQKKAEVVERVRLDGYQEEQLLARLQEVVAEFNRRSSLGIIAEQRRAQALQFSLPFGGSLLISFFHIDPPLHLRAGSVRFAAVVKDDIGAGFNYLLIRKDDSDLYGEWKAYRVSYSALTNRNRVPKRPPVFGFATPEEMREIEMADMAMHIYALGIRGDVQEVFLELLRDAINRRKPI